jgi:hypothetical protein
VPEEDIVRAMIRVVRMDLCGPAENVVLPSYEGGFLRSFRERMRCFYDLLREKPFFLFIILGWSPISVASLTMRSMFLDLEERIVVWCSWMPCGSTTKLTA